MGIADNELAVLTALGQVGALEECEAEAEPRPQDGRVRDGDEPEADHHQDDGADDGGDQQQDLEHGPEVPIRVPGESTVKALAQLGHDAARLREGPQWVAYLQLCSRFHSYSPRNRMLILFQYPQASRVAGYRTWQQLGRQVRKGEHAIRVLAPLTKKNTDGETEMYGFKLVPVFDVNQTEGEDLTPQPDWPMLDVCPEGLFQDLVVQAAADDVEVRLVDDSEHGEARGWYVRAERTISIREALPEPEQVNTLLHELGHHFDPSLSDYREGELVAESAAYIAGARLGVGLHEQATAYLASWRGTDAALLVVAERVTVAADAITELANRDLEGAT